MKSNQTYSGLEVAVIGMACRLPGASNWRQYWSNIENGIEAIRTFTDEELLSSGVDAATLNHPSFVKAGSHITEKDVFDYNFFDYSPAEARLLNPEHRIFHELVWEALEDAGCNPELIKGQVGVFAGAGDDFNWQVYSTLKNKEVEDVDGFMLGLIQNKDHLSTLISYKLNLTGPSLAVSTACSTSLVAINLACKSLLFGEAKVALAGGISVHTQKQKGYMHEEGMISSVDGHCRTFDKDATGTISAEGAGVVVLKRLTDALNDGDHIYGIVKGSAINNDGNKKVGYTAPSVEGQAECIRKAQAFAKVDADSISYIEAHGTGTRLGDPIEIEALNLAFNSSRKNACAIGSVKSAIGHTDSAAGVAGFIKGILSLYHKKIAPSLHYVAPNPEINFSGGPFYVNTKLQDWQANGHPLRAGVSSFGIGGTNAHAVIEEAPVAEPAGHGREWKLLTLSARSEESLNKYIQKLHSFVGQHPEINPADLAYTLQTGRKHFAFRRQLLFSATGDLLTALAPDQPVAGIVKSKDRQKSVVMMFPGQGSQYNNMCRGLYDAEPVFREEMDKGFGIIERLTGENFKAVLFPEQEGSTAIQETRYTQPLLFLTEYALAKMLQSLSVQPSYMIGHSIGEYTAAAISGVFSMEDALRLVVKRGAIMSKVAPGVMVSAVLDESEASPYLSGGISLAAVNGPGQVVFSGSFEAVEVLKTQLTDNAVPHVVLHTSHAFHSAMLDNILQEFEAEFGQVTLNRLQIPFISNLTGTFITPEEAVSPKYWVRHMRETVKFSQGLQTLLAHKPDLVYVEVGAGHVLSSLLKQHAGGSKQVIVNMVRPVKEAVDDIKYFTGKTGSLWASGVAIDWQKFYQTEKRRKISLPTYVFDHVKFPVEVNPFENMSMGNTETKAVTAVPPVHTAAPVADPLPEVAAADTTVTATMPAGSAVTAPVAEVAAVVPAKPAETPAVHVSNIDVPEDDAQAFEEEVVEKLQRPELSTPFVAAATSTELRLTNLIENFFNIDRIGVEDSFLELGGDSLKGMVILKKIKGEFDINFPLKDFFGKQNIREIADEIDNILQQTGSAGTKPVKRSITI